ncbi:hypothetical protein C923_01041, partial [Plasmodium falciparum UGT5.1]
MKKRKKENPNDQQISNVEIKNNNCTNTSEIFINTGNNPYFLRSNNKKRKTTSYSMQKEEDPKILRNHHTHENNNNNNNNNNCDHKSLEHKIHYNNNYTINKEFNQDNHNNKDMYPSNNNKNNSYKKKKNVKCTNLLSNSQNEKKIKLKNSNILKNLNDKYINSLMYPNNTIPKKEEIENFVSLFYKSKDKNKSKKSHAYHNNDDIMSIQKNKEKYVHIVQSLTNQHILLNDYQTGDTNTKNSYRHNNNNNNNNSNNSNNNNNQYDDQYILANEKKISSKTNLFDEFILNHNNSPLSLNNDDHINFNNDNLNISLNSLILDNFDKNHHNLFVNDQEEMDCLVENYKNNSSINYKDDYVPLSNHMNNYIYNNNNNNNSDVGTISNFINHDTHKYEQNEQLKVNMFNDHSDIYEDIDKNKSEYSNEYNMNQLINSSFIDNEIIKLLTSNILLKQMIINHNNHINKNQFNNNVENTSLCDEHIDINNHMNTYHHDHKNYKNNYQQTESIEQDFKNFICKYILNNKINDIQNNMHIHKEHEHEVNIPNMENINNIENVENILYYLDNNNNATEKSNTTSSKLKKKHSCKGNLYQNDHTDSDYFTKYIHPLDKNNLINSYKSDAHNNEECNIYTNILQNNNNNSVVTLTDIKNFIQNISDINNEENKKFYNVFVKKVRDKYFKH